VSEAQFALARAFRHWRARGALHYERVFLWRDWGKRKKEIVGQAAKTTKVGIGARNIVTGLNRPDTNFSSFQEAGTWRSI
jgi:hypothetical protein